MFKYRRRKIKARAKKPFSNKYHWLLNEDYKLPILKGGTWYDNGFGKCFSVIPAELRPVSKPCVIGMKTASFLPNID